jgi:predicted transcriptional regulator
VIREEKVVLSKLDFEQLKDAVASRSPVMEKDEGRGNPVTQEQFLYFLEKLEEIMMKLDREIENIQRDIEKIKS